MYPPGYIRVGTATNPALQRGGRRAARASSGAGVRRLAGDPGPDDVVGEGPQPPGVLAVRRPVEGVGVEEDEVGGVPDRDRAPAVGRGGERLAGGDRLLGVPRLAVVAGAVDRAGDGEPRVERGHRGVGAQDDVDAVVEHPPQREAALRTARPEPLGDVAVVEEVRGLDAGAHAEARHAAYVVTRGELHVLDAAAG